MKPLEGQHREDYFRKVADQLIEQIEAGTAPWVQSWEPGERVQPYNLKTSKAYRGGNSTWLASVASMRGYKDERWGTYRQIQEAGGQVLRGQKGASIIYWQWEARQLKRDEAGAPVLDADKRPVYETTPLQRPRSYTYTVFNAEQAEGLPPRPARAPGHQWDRLERVEQLFENTGAVVEHSGLDRVYYNLGEDKIVLPRREQFPSPAGYYQSALHELGHWTGHPDRMNRESLIKGVREGPASLEYSREELRAEISSMITGDRLEVGHDGSRTAAYCDFWVKTLRDHPQEIYLASRDAQDISDYIMERGRMIEHTREGAERDQQREEPRDIASGGAGLGADPERAVIEMPQAEPPSQPAPERAADKERSLEPSR